jgi:ABC-type sugar transport system ATPase subunit
MPLALTPPKGISAVVTHNILDVMAVTDRLVILHRGCKAAEVPTKDTNEHEIVSLIMGRGCASKGKGEETFSVRKHATRTVGKDGVRKAGGYDTSSRVRIIVDIREDHNR